MSKGNDIQPGVNTPGYPQWSLRDPVGSNQHTPGRCLRSYRVREPYQRGFFRVYSLVRPVCVGAGYFARRRRLAGQARQLVRKLNAEESAVTATPPSKRRSSSARPSCRCCRRRRPYAGRRGPPARPDPPDTLVATGRRRGQTSLVTLKGEGLPLCRCSRHFSKQTGNKIADYRNEFGEEVTEPKLYGQFRQDLLLDGRGLGARSARLATYGYAGQPGLYVINRPQDQVAVQRPCEYQRSVSHRAHAVRSRPRFAQPPKVLLLKLLMDVSWEPRLLPILISQPLDQIRATGSGGEPIGILDGAEGEPEATINGDSSAVELQIPLELPERSVSKIASLSRQAYGAGAGHVEDVPLRAVAHHEGRAGEAGGARKAGVTVFIDMVRKNNDIWEVRMRGEA